MDDSPETSFSQYKFSHVYKVLTDIQSCKKDSQIIPEHFGTLTNVWNEMDVYLPLSTYLKELTKQQEETRYV